MTQESKRHKFQKLSGGELEEWVNNFLCGEGENKVLAEGLRKQKRHWIGFVEISLDMLDRCCGWESYMEYKEPLKKWNERVNLCIDFIESGGKLSPFIVFYTKGLFSIRDGNHRYEAYKRLGFKKYWVAIWCNSIGDKIEMEKLLNIQSKVFFISGVPGAGKTSLIKPLSSLLGSNFDIHDFDERGVPDNVNIEWRISETAYWIDIANKNSLKGISTIICGNSIPEISSELQVIFLILDLSEEKIRERLLNRYNNPEKVKDLKRMTGQTPEESIQANIYNTHSLRKLFKEHKIKSIDTSYKTSEKVAEEAALYILSYYEK